MLKSLTIKNYALISDAEIEFGPGLNILTGETGAGKSILMGALSTILGERVDTSALRDGAKKAIIEGCFEIKHRPALETFLQEHGLIDENPELILRREIQDTGRTRAFVNDSPVQVATLQAVGDFLVDLHGQHDHQSLLKESHHLHFLDEFGDLQDDVVAVKCAYEKLNSCILQCDALVKNEQDLSERRDYLAFQIEEIDKLNPNPDEESELLAEAKLIQHSERLFELTSELYRTLYDSENSVFDQLSAALNKISELAKIDGKTATHFRECESAKVIVEELAKSFQSYNSGIEFNPERLEAIQSRLSELSGLKKKYQKSLSDIVEYKQHLQDELVGLSNLHNEIESLRTEIFKHKAHFSTLCWQLSQHRRQAADGLEQQIPAILEYLGMPGSRFKVSTEYQNDPNGLVFLKDQSYRAGSDGMDIAKFNVSANIGEGLRPLAKVASGGEISRIMLSLKSVLAKEGMIPVLVFDEIDLGVSGRVARAVGHRLKALSEYHQVLCITHLPQIASMGKNHYLVEKSELEGRTHTSIRKVNSGEREEAIAQLLAGEKISEAHLNSARELLQDADVSRL